MSAPEACTICRLPTVQLEGGVWTPQPGVLLCDRCDSVPAAGADRSTDGDATLLASVGDAAVADFIFCVVSSGRPQNVKEVESKLTTARVVWFVGLWDRDVYVAAGAAECFVGGGLCASRNAALDFCEKNDKVCVQLSDDISRLSFVDSPEDAAWSKPATIQVSNERASGATTNDVSFTAAAMFIAARARAAGLFFGGVYPNANAGQALANAAVTHIHFIVGDFIVVLPGSPIRFDEKMSLKEDYDFTAQHLQKHGGGARCNRLLIYASHYDNAGGAVAVRNGTREAGNIRRLRRKWPGVFLNSPRGPSEVRMRWATRDVVLGGTRVFEPDKGGRATYPQSKAIKIREKRLLKEAEMIARGEDPYANEKAALPKVQKPPAEVQKPPPKRAKRA